MVEEPSSSMGEDYPKQQARVREVLKNYEDCYALPDGSGRGCIFAITMIKKTLADAEKAAISGDLVAMIRCYQDMKETQ